MNKKLLSSALEGDHSALKNRLKKIGIEAQSQSKRIKGSFYYLPIVSNKPTIDEFIEYIYIVIAQYCIPKKERSKASKEDSKNANSVQGILLHDKAKKLFIQAKEQQKKSGEVGELILFSILEGYFNAPQILCKMYHKTSPEMPVFGSDGIHTMLDEDDNLTLVWGESKMYQTLSNAIDSIIASVEEFILGKVEGNKKLRKAPSRSRDIDFIKDHATISSPKLKNKLLNMVNPFHDDYNKFTEIYACLAGFDYFILRDIDKNKALKFEEIYKKKAEKAFNQFEKKVNKNTNIKDLRFMFFLLPFDSVGEFRKKFFKRIGAGQ